jgi:dihydrofolate reductase
MRKLTVLEHISIDGVIQAPGGPEEDPSENFPYGGWSATYDDDVLGAALSKMMNMPFDLLLGRKTFDIWAAFWPNHADIWPGAQTATKYVASNTLTTSDWKTTVFLNGDVADKVAKLKQTPGPDLHTWGSSNLLQTLIKHDLVDQYWLMIYPVTLGTGKRLFAQGTIPAAFKVTESHVAPNGAIVVSYERNGDIKTGTAGPE